VSSGVFRFLGAKVLSGEAKDIVPGGPAEVAGGFSIAGRFKGRTEIELSFGYSPEAAVTQRIVLDPTAALEPERGEFIRRVWAQKRVAELLPDPKKNEAFIAQTGRDFGIVTPFNSLLVLERIEDYAEHGIEPPEPELRERWQKLMGDMKKQRRPQQVRDHLAELIKEWREFREWHGKRHPWLETVLAPAAKREAGIIRQLVKAGKSKGLTAAEADLAATIAESAQGLAQRWRQEGADPAARPAWEKEAVETMLKLDALRQKRIAAAPESEAAASEHAQELYGLSRPRREAGDAAADPFSSGSAPSAPAPAPPPAPAADRTSPGAPRMAPSRGEGRGGFDTGRGLAPAKAGEDAEAPAADSGLSAGIEIKPWTPNAAYLKALRKAPDAYAAYLKERAANARSSAFFLDCADFFRDEKKDARLALRVLSNLAEMDYESAPLLRILAARLQQTGRYDLAVPMLEEVLAMRPEEPQSRRDLALALSRQSAPDFSRSIALLWEVAGKPWDNRFSGIGLIALHELHAVLASCPQDGRPDMKSLNIPAELMEPVETGLRVVLTWDADATDIDLWVTDPAGETVMYNHNRGKTGGHVSNDFTQGYGPEVFTIRRPLPGTYTVRINYYGNRQQKFAGATTVQVEFQTAFGKADAKREAITRRLTDQREIIEVGRFTWKPTPLP
jgi:tetratricopeptide (TPR) repeat protein